MTAANPFEVHGGVLGTFDPVLLSISGGRTSGMLLYRILEAYEGQLPRMIRPAFMNTGREMNQTLDFVAEMSRRWNVNITWLERDFEAPEGFRIVNHNSAARHGMRTPFDDVIERRKFLPNAISRFCTVELKIQPSKRWMKSLGYKKWCNVLGYRADEAHRLLKAQKPNRDPWYTLAPLVDAGITKRHVAMFWAGQPFDLQLPNVKGKTPLGNCDGCMLKSKGTLAGIARDYPDRFAWWPNWETAMCGLTQSAQTATFRPPTKLTHTQIADMVRRQQRFDFIDESPGIDCFCTD